MSHTPTAPDKWRWFPESRHGLFLHWGPYATYGRGEQVLFREHLDPCEYEANACAWNPEYYDPALWVEIAKKAGFKYAVFTTRHHDGYCLWDTATTDYSSARQAPQRDFVREFVDAFRAAGLRIGLYHSLLDWRIPAWFEGPEVDTEAWTSMADCVHAQGEEPYIHGLPRTQPTPLFPIIKITCAGRPAADQWGRECLWNGDPTRVADWARRRGETVKANKS